MIGIFLNSEELERIHQVPILARSLYLAIRETIDFNTGYAGKKTPVSWEGFAATLSTPSRRGYAGETFSIDQMKRAAKHLESAGLITNHSNKKQHRLILKCGIAINQRPPDATDKETQQSRTLRAIEGGKAARIKIKPARQNEQRPPESPLEAETNKAEENPVFSRTEEAKAARKPDRQNYESPRNIRDTTTVLYCTNAYAREKREGTPDSFMDLVNFFTEEHGFPHHKTHTPATVPLFKLWIDQGITYQDLNEAIEIANNTNGGQPGTPVYYRNFVSQLKASQKREAESWQQQQNAPAQQPTGGRHYAKPTTAQDRRRIFESGYHPDKNRKLTPAERSSVAYGTDPDTLRKFDEQDQEPGYDDAIDAIDGLAWVIE